MLAARCALLTRTARSRRRRGRRRGRTEPVRARLHGRRTACASARPPRSHSACRSFDGVPLDADVTLPASGTGPFPTIVMLHGWGGSKTSFESTSPAGDGNETFDYNNVYYAQHGYAVRQLLRARLGQLVRHAGIAHRTGLRRRLDHARRPALRGTRHAVPARPARRRADRQARPIGVTGISYGGGQSIELAYLKNRVRLPERRIRAVDEPGRQAAGNQGGLPALAVVGPRRRADAQRTLPRHTSRAAGQSCEPLGVEIQSYVTGLLALGSRAATSRRPAPIPKPT